MSFHDRLLSFLCIPYSFILIYLSEFSVVWYIYPFSISPSSSFTRINGGSCCDLRLFDIIPQFVPEFYPVMFLDVGSLYLIILSRRSPSFNFPSSLIVLACCVFRHHLRGMIIGFSFVVTTFTFFYHSIPPVSHVFCLRALNIYTGYPYLEDSLMNFVVPWVLGCTHSSVFCVDDSMQRFKQQK